MEPGQWTKMQHGDQAGVVVCCGKCGAALSVPPTMWTLTFHEDGTFSATPSLLHVGPTPDGTPECGWHVVITRSEY